jgi:hypothetical protein
MFTKNVGMTRAYRAVRTLARSCFSAVESWFGEM